VLLAEIFLTGTIVGSSHASPHAGEAVLAGVRLLLRETTGASTSPIIADGDTEFTLGSMLSEAGTKTIVLFADIETNLSIRKK
jgi:hypothetical protein